MIWILTEFGVIIKSNIEQFLFNVKNVKYSKWIVQ